MKRKQPRRRRKAKLRASDRFTPRLALAPPPAAPRIRRPLASTDADTIDATRADADAIPEASSEDTRVDLEALPEFEADLDRWLALLDSASAAACRIESSRPAPLPLGIMADALVQRLEVETLHASHAAAARLRSALAPLPTQLADLSDEWRRALVEQLGDVRGMLAHELAEAERDHAAAERQLAAWLDVRAVASASYADAVIEELDAAIARVSACETLAAHLVAQLADVGDASLLLARAGGLSIE